MHIDARRQARVALLKAHPKAFFGYSDNTNLHNFLWNLGIVSYHGGSIMVEFGRGGSMQPYTQASLMHALFERGEYEIHASPVYTDENKDWHDLANLDHHPELFPSTGWRWHNAKSSIEGTLWGGNSAIPIPNLFCPMAAIYVLMAFSKSSTLAIRLDGAKEESNS